MSNGVERAMALLRLIIGYLKQAVSRLWNVFKSAAWYIKLPMVLIGIVLAFFVLLLAIDINLFNLFGESPTAEQIDYTAQAEASEIYSADGKLMGKFFSENRSPVNDTSEVSAQLIQTLVCTEDARFWEHSGIDFRGLFSAMKDFVHGKPRGASTLTQQLAKNLFRMRSDKLSSGLLGRTMFVTKMKEWIVAFKLERRYSKPQILTMYLNTVDFGSNAFGIRTAAKTYFGVTPKQLNYEQSAVLVGLLKATSYYNPRIHYDNALARRNVVLGILRDFKLISKDELKTMCEDSIRLDFNVEKNYDGWGLHFRDAVSSYLRLWCKKNKINLYTSGLKIYTTLDSSMQAYAEHAVWKQMQEVQRRFNNHWGNDAPWQSRDHKEIPGFVDNVAKKSEAYAAFMKKYSGDTIKVNEAMNKPRKMKVFAYKVNEKAPFYSYRNDSLISTDFRNPGRKDTVLSPMDSIIYTLKFLHSSFVALEPSTGYVKAWVGDLDFPTWKYDKVTSYRQPGSTFKLFDYTEAFNQGMCPCDERIDEPISWEVWDKAKGKRVYWTPHNADGHCLGVPFSLKAAFARSINTIAVQIAKDCGIENINATAHKMGIHSFLDDTVPATALGACDVSLLELTNSYCTVMNDGVYHEPILVTKVTDRDGNVIFTPENTDKQVLDYEVAFLMQDLLHGGLTEPEGTVGALWEYIHPVLRLKGSDGKMHDNQFGGKTGTSSNHSDAWFIGVTPNLVAGCWVGGEYRSIHFRTGELGQGSRTALPVYGYFIQYLLQNPEYRELYGGMFAKPKQRISRNYNCKRYVYVTDSTSTADDEVDDGALELDE